MDQEKHGDCDASKKEDEDDDNAGMGRSYECTFCKRGFTNAQALGGHMNIHRKDKAKPKPNHKNQSLDISKENHLDSMFVSVNDHHQQMLGYQMHLPSSNPSFQIGNYLPFHRFGEGGVSVEENGVDLELRLGLIDQSSGFRR